MVNKTGFKNTVCTGTVCLKILAFKHVLMLVTGTNFFPWPTSTEDALIAD